MDEEWQPLTADQISHMTWTRVQETGKSVELTYTVELECDYRDWLKSECSHQVIEMQHVLYTEGKGHCYREQCVLCGRAFSTAKSPSKIRNVDNLESVSIKKNDDYEADRREQLQQMKLKHYRIQNENNELRYETYLKSEAWRSLRKRVLNRANGVCEGCAECPPTQVHHLTDSHKYTELMWELVAVCDACHAKAHGAH